MKLHRNIFTNYENIMEVSQLKFFSIACSVF